MAFQKMEVLFIFLAVLYTRLIFIVSNLIIEKSTFTQNQALYSGGALYLNNFNSSDIQDSTFEKNKASEGVGANIYAVDSNSYLSLANTEIKDSKVSSSIYLE